jgi:hypothetical protein
MAICHHFFSAFHHLKFRGVEVARYVFYDFLNHLLYYNINEILQAIPRIKQDVTRSDVFSLLDSDYPCIIKPGKKIYIDPREFSDAVVALLPLDRVIGWGVQQGTDFSAPLERLVVETEAELKKCSGDFIFGSSLFQQWLVGKMSDVVRELVDLADLFDREEISCVVSRFAFYWPCRALLALAKSRGIPSIAYQPGVLIGNNGRSDAWWPVADMPIVATYKTVWGQQFKEFFMSFGIPEHRLPVIGNPYFDRIRSYQAISNAEFRSKYGIPDSHQVILHLTQWPNSRRLATVKAAVDAAKALPDTTLLIKTRDFREEQALYQDMIANHPRIKLLDEKQSIYDLIANSDVVLVFFSTCGVETMLFGKPVVIIDVKHEEPPYSYAELGAPEAQNGAELEALLRKMFSDPDYRREVRARIAERLPYLCLTDGKAIPRLAEFILKVADGEYINNEPD